MKILIIDIETTGFLNEGGEIVEIGAVELCLNTGNREIVFNEIIKPNLPEKEIKKSWIVQNNYMNIDEILNGVPFYSIKDKLQNLVNKYPNGATAFNRSFDFDFLKKYGIKFPKELPCPMLASTNICKIPKTGKAAFYPGFKWPNVEEAYKFFYPKSNYTEIHRGACDAFHEANIVLALHKMNKFI